MNRNIYIDAMRDVVNNQEEPKVGIFWYNVKTNELFGIAKADAIDLQFNHNGAKTVRTLHKSLWKKEQMKKNPLFRGDYTQTPRGRIFEIKNEGFQLMVGNWIHEIGESKIINLVKEEFDLQNIDLKLVIDSHWDIGHGWSELFE